MINNPCSVSLLFLRFLALLVVFSGPVRAEVLSISGSNTLGAKLIPECARAYLLDKGARQPVIVNSAENEFVVESVAFDDQFVIRAHGSSTGFRALRNSEAVVAMSSRPIKAAEVVSLSSTGDMLSPQAEHTVAVDGLAVLVHPDNPVSSLSIEQIAQLFAGQIKNWSVLGGIDAPVSLHARDENSGTWDTFKNLVLKKNYQLSQQAQRYESNDALSDRVAEDIGAIGFSGLASVRNAKALAVSNGDMAAVAPTRMSVATEDYPLTRRLYLYSPVSLRTEAISEFIDFCQSQRGQDIVAEVGFVSQNIIAVAQQPLTNAPGAYNALAEKAERLSVNFRFHTGSSKLDNKALKDVERLINYLKQPENSQRPIYLVGFSDKAKTTNNEKILSRFRALAVWSELFSENILVYEALGFGAFMPLADSQSDMAKLKNSRVEVWIAKQ